MESFCVKKIGVCLQNSVVAPHASSRTTHMWNKFDEVLQSACLDCLVRYKKSHVHI